LKASERADATLLESVHCEEERDVSDVTLAATAPRISIRESASRSRFRVVDFVAILILPAALVMLVTMALLPFAPLTVDIKAVFVGAVVFGLGISLLIIGITNFTFRVDPMKQAVSSHKAECHGPSKARASKKGDGHNISGTVIADRREKQSDDSTDESQQPWGMATFIVTLIVLHALGWVQLPILLRRPHQTNDQRQNRPVWNISINPGRAPVAPSPLGPNYPGKNSPKPWQPPDPSSGEKPVTSKKAGSP